VLVLGGRTVPLQGFEFSVEQRGETRWQVGSAEGEALLSGPELPPTDFEFRWKQRTLAGGATLDGAQVDTVEDLVAALWGMARDSVLVTIEWERWNQVGWIQRVGVPIERPREFAVTLTVEWVKESEQQQRRRPKPAANFGEEIIGVADPWTVQLRKVRRPVALNQQAGFDVEDLLVEVNRSLNEADRARRRFRNSRATAISTAGKMAESFGRIVRLGDSIRTEASRPPHDVLPIDEPSSRIVFEYYRSSAARAGVLARHEAARRRRKLLNEARPDVLFRHVASQDQDLRMLAYQTYGRVDAWSDIASFNELASSVLQAGQSILMPRLEALRLADVAS
jgi:hypothetical protein